MSANTDIRSNYKLPYKVYVAYVNQTGTNPPVETIEQNTLSGTPVWGYSSVGTYTLTLNGEFPTVSKVIIFTSLAGAITIVNPGNFHSAAVITAGVTNANTIFFTTFLNGGPPNNDQLQNASIEIRVYP